MKLDRKPIAVLNPAPQRTPEAIRIINNASIEDLCSEYNNILLKRSKLSASQRAHVAKRVLSLIEIGQITPVKVPKSIEK